MDRAFKICAEGKGDELTKDQLFNYLCALGALLERAAKRCSNSLNLTVAPLRKMQASPQPRRR
jgi:hypothetical protein